jgi:glycosyltransferase involved in cell wall biosynthesis
MHLAINGSDLGRQRGGNESYMMGLLGSLAEAAQEAKIQVSVLAPAAGVQLLETLPEWHALQIVDLGPYRRFASFLWQQSVALRTLRADWFLSTFFLPCVVPCQAAVLIHDLSFRSYPEYYPWPIAIYMRLLTGSAIGRADAVIALSEFTHREILRFYPPAEPKTVVVYPGIGDEFRAESSPDADERTLATLSVERPYLLAVGNIHPRKNLGRLLTAWEQVKNTGRPVPRMVWVGLGRWDSGELIERAETAGVQMLGFVAQEHLPALYRQAEALVYPSLYEGFGLPPVEAMACGTPALTSNSTSLPEAVGDAAVVVDTTSIDAIAEGLSQILFDQELRRDLRARGLAQAAHFTWEQTTTKLLDTLAHGPLGEC